MKHDLNRVLTSCLVPPGDGVFTVNTAKERKEAFQQAHYGTTENVTDVWKDSLTQVESQTLPLMLGVASDCGGGILRGANWGPLFIRSTLKEQHGELSYFDLGDIRVNPHLLHDKYLNETTIGSVRNAFYQDENTDLPVSPLSLTEFVTQQVYASNINHKVMALGGDHSISYPLTRSYLKAKKAAGIKTAIIHFDAHTDLLKERLGIDLCFGSWCTHILDDLPKPNHLIQLGIRSSGKPKQHWQDTFGVVQHWAHEIKEQGAEAIVDNIIEQLKADGVDELYVSFDIDALDDEFACATGTPEPDGMTPDDVDVILTKLTKHFPITGADMMEVAPFTDSRGRGQEGAEKTLAVAAKITAMLVKAMS